MKGKTSRATGGPATGAKEWEEDLKSKPAKYTGGKPADEAEERKAGGRVGRKSGGAVHHERGKHLGHAKHVGMVHGSAATSHAGRKPRKSGGRAGSNMNPLSSAHKGMDPPGHKALAVD